MSTTKLAINVREGTVEVEGDEAFVRYLYEDFKEQIGKLVTIQPAPATVPRAIDLPALTDDAKSNKPSKAGRRASAKGTDKPRATQYKPAFSTKLDLSQLESFYDEYDFDNHSEKILAFAILLREKLSIAPCTADDIFSCYATLKKKTSTPTAFLQAFYVAQQRTHFIEFVSTAEIRINIAGDNHFNKSLKKKTEAGK